MKIEVIDEIIRQLTYERDKMDAVVDIEHELSSLPDYTDTVTGTTHTGRQTSKAKSKERTGLSEKQQADKATAEEIDTIITSLRKLKDRLVEEQHEDPDEMDLLPVMEKRLTRSSGVDSQGRPIGQIGSMYSPWSYGDLGDNDTGVWSRDAMLDIQGKLAQKGVSRKEFARQQVKSLREEAREHRRAMNANIAEAVRRHQETIEKYLQEDRETPTTHFKRLHREIKVEAQAVLYNYKGRKPGAAIITPEHLKWFKVKIREDLKCKIKERPAQDPPSEVQDLWGMFKPIRPNVAVSKICEQLEMLRKDMLLIPQVLDAVPSTSVLFEPDKMQKRIKKDSERVPPLLADLCRNLKDKHDALVAGVIEEGGVDTAVLHYPPDYNKVQIGSGTDAWDSYELKLPPDENGIVPPPKNMPDQNFAIRAKDAAHFKKYFFEEKPDAYVATLHQMARMVEYHYHGRQGSPKKLDDATRTRLKDDAVTAAQEIRKLLYKMHVSKRERDNANRVYREISTLNDSSKFVKEQITRWNQQMEFLRGQYRMLHSLDTTKEAAFKEGVAAVVGALLRSQGVLFGADKELLYKMLVASTGAQYQHLLAPYKKELQFGEGRELAEPEWAGHWLRWVLSLHRLKRSFDQLASFRQRLEAADTIKFKKIRATAYTMCEQYLLELCYLAELADADDKARAERDWVKYSRDLESLVRRAKGLIIYIDRFEGSYNKIKFVVGKLLKDLTVNDYPTLGEVSLCISVALGVGVESDIASVSVALALQITGTLCHEDDRRVRFKGAFSINIKGEASLGTPGISSGGPQDQDHYEHAASWAGIKAQVSAEKGLLSATRVWTYTDHEHLAASWGHKVALARTHMYRPIDWVKHPFDRSSGMEVINVRSASEEEEEVLKLVVGDDEELKKVIDRIRKPVTNSFSWWQGFTNWGDLQVAGDVTANVLVAGCSPHVERLTHNQRATHFWKTSYEGGKAHEVNWTRTQKSGDDTAPVKCVDVLVDVWGKSYPPMLSAGGEYALNKFTAPQMDPNDALAMVSEGTTSQVFSVGYSKDVGVCYEVEFGLTRRDPNPDRNGLAMSVVGVRGHGVSFGVGDNVGFSANKTLARNINPYEVRFLLHQLRDLDKLLSQGCTAKSAPVDDDDPGEGAKAIVEHAMSGTLLGTSTVGSKLSPGRLRGELFKKRNTFHKLTAFGKLEMGFGYSDDTTPPRWIMENARIWRSYDVGVQGKIPLGTSPFYIEMSGSVERTFVVCEVVGSKGLGYIQGVFDGLAHRQPEDKQSADPARWRFWQEFREKHKQELYDLCRNVALAPAAADTTNNDPGYVALPCYYELDGDVGGVSNASDWRDACTMTGADAHAADKTYSFTPPVRTPIVTRLATNVTNTVSVNSCAAVGVALFDKMTGETSTWFPIKPPPVTGQTTPPADIMPKDKDFRPDNVFYINPRGQYEILALVENPECVSNAKLTMTPGGWTKTLEDADKQPPPPPEKGILKKALAKGLEFLDLKHDDYEDTTILSRYDADLKEKYAGRNVALYHVPLDKTIYEKIEATKLTRIGLTVEYDASKDCSRPETWTYCYALGKWIDDPLASNAAPLASNATSPVSSVELDPLLTKMEAYLKGKWQEKDERPLHWVDAKGRDETEVVQVDPDDDAGDIGVLEFEPSSLTTVPTKYKYLAIYYDRSDDASAKPATFLSNAALCASVEFSGDTPLPTQASNAAFANIEANTVYNAILVYGSKREIATGETRLDNQGQPCVFQGWTAFASHLNLLKTFGITTETLILDFSYSAHVLDYFVPLLANSGMALCNATRTNKYYNKHFFDRIQAIEAATTPADTDVKNIWWDCFSKVAEEYKTAYPKADGVPCAVYRKVSEKMYRSDKGAMKGFLEKAYPSSGATLWKNTEKAIERLEKMPIVKKRNSYWYIKKLEAGLEQKKAKS
ncbi:MAG: hypothetical protein AB7E47_01235 [Desulfovibrionaceae bacterium]